MQITSKKIYMTLAIVLIVFLLALPKLKIFNADKDSAGTAGFNAALPVSAYIVKPEKLKDQVQTTGTVLSNEEVEIQSEISGRVIEIKFKEGRRVNKGALLVKINDAELQASLLKAEFEKNLAKDKEERGQKQVKIEAISQEDYDVLLNELNTKKAEIKLVLAQIEKTEIRAPFDGIVGLRYVSEGSFIVQNTKIANLLDINPVKVDFALPEKYVNLVQAVDKIFFRIQGFADEFEGEVYAIEPKINTTTRTLQLRASCPNPNGAILP